MRILVIEDEIKTANYIKTGLTSSGFFVSLATDGKEGVFLATEHDFDLVILDVMLPKLDGWCVITEVRRKRPDLKILFLTSRDAINDKVKAFQLGADDYLIKPFAFCELLERIKALLRRGSLQKTNQIKISDLRIDLIKHKVFRGSKQIELTSQEFSLLLYLAEHEGQLVSRTLIAEAVWDINFNTETNVVDVAIRRLRQKIDLESSKKLIHTIRGRGYILEER